MTTVRLFAAAADAAGTSELHRDVPTLAVLQQSLLQDHPLLATVLPRCSYLVDGLAAHGEADLTDLTGAITVDVLPPFAGG